MFEKERFSVSESNHDHPHQHSHSEECHHRKPDPKVDHHSHSLAHSHAHAHTLSGASHSHHPMSLNKTFALAVFLNLLFVALELFYGLTRNSLALIADASHNLSDVAGLLLAWAGVFANRSRPTASRTYGWQRTSIFAAFLNATLLMTAMGALCWEAWSRLWSEAHTDGSIVIAVAATGVFLNGFTAMLFFRDSHSDLNLRGAFLHLISDAAISGGVVVSGLLYLQYGWNWIDPLTSMLIALVILVSTFKLFQQSLHLLFDGVPTHIKTDEVRSFLESFPGVKKIHDLHIWALSTSETSLTAHLLMPQGHPGDSFLLDLDQCLQEKFGISHCTFQVETQELKHRHCDGEVNDQIYTGSKS